MTRDSNPRQARSNRRSFIKATAGIAATVGVPAMMGSVTAEQTPEHEKRYKEALAARENSGDTEDFRKELQKTGGQVASSDKHIQIERENPDGPTTDAVTHDDVELRTTMTKYPEDENEWEYSVVYVDLDFDVEFTLRDGDKPHDPVGLGWEEREYDYDDFHYSSDSINWGGYNKHGVSFLYRDEDDDCHCEQTGRQVGTRAQIEEGDPYSRHVNVTYWHTFHNTTLSDVTIDQSGNISFTLSDEEKKWDRPAQDRIEESNAD